MPRVELSYSGQGAQFGASISPGVSGLGQEGEMRCGSVRPLLVEWEAVGVTSIGRKGFGCNGERCESRLGLAERWGSPGCDGAGLELRRNVLGCVWGRFV